MIFTTINSIVLGNVQKYGELATSGVGLTAAQNTNRAIQSLANLIVSDALEESEDITTESRSSSLNAIYTPTATDIQSILKIRYKVDDNNYWDLVRVSQHNLLQKVPDLGQAGRPTVYLIQGNTSNIIDLAMYPVTAYAGETITLYYMPIIADLSGATENVITQRYFNEVIELSTKLSERNILQRNVTVEEIVKLTEYLASQINSREQSAPDYENNPLPPPDLISRRRSRRTQ